MRFEGQVGGAFERNVNIRASYWPSIDAMAAARKCREAVLTANGRREGRAPTPTIRLTAAPEKPGAQPSAPTPKSNLANGFAAQSVRTVARDTDGSGNGNAPTVRANSLKNNAGTAADGADTNGARRSGAAELPPSERRCGPSTGASEFSTN